MPSSAAHGAWGVFRESGALMKITGAVVWLNGVIGLLARGPPAPS